MHTFLPTVLRGKLGCALYTGIVITHHECNDGYNYPMCDVHGHSWVHIIHAKYGTRESGIVLASAAKLATVTRLHCMGDCEEGDSVIAHVLGAEVGVPYVPTQKGGPTSHKTMISN